MSTRKPHTAKLSPPPADAPAAVDASHNIWLAGRGAFAKAQAEGGKAFEALVRASDAATNRWGLEHIVQERVARALANRGVPSPEQWAALETRVQALEQMLAQSDAPMASPRSKSATPARKQSQGKRM